jgi:hypothetical protein
MSKIMCYNEYYFNLLFSQIYFFKYIIMYYDGFPSIKQYVYNPYKIDIP